MLRPLPPTFASTRDALHMVAEHVLAPARYRAARRIGLRATPGGFGTPEFGDGERIRVEGDELVYEHAGDTQRTRLTTARAAAAFVGIEPGLPPGIYEPATVLCADEPLGIDADAAHALGTWYALGNAALAGLDARYVGTAPSEIQLWPEHFDLARDLGDTDAGTRANYGASPGDTTVVDPYLYVGPWDTSRRTGRFAEFPFGAALQYRDLLDADDQGATALQFFGDCAAALLG